MFKFRDTNVTSDDNSSKLSDLQLKWGPFLSMAAMIPNVSILLVNLNNYNIYFKIFSN
jgi:hypothetical protein